MGATFLNYQTISILHSRLELCLSWFTSRFPATSFHDAIRHSDTDRRSAVARLLQLFGAAGAPRLRRTSKLTASGAAWLQLTAKSRGISRCGTSVASAPALPIGEAEGLSSSTNDLAIGARHRRGVNLPTSIQHVMLAIKNRHVAACMRSSARRKIIVRMLLFREAIR